MHQECQKAQNALTLGPSGWSHMHATYAWDIAEIKREVAAGCFSCTLVLDAVTSYSKIDTQHGILESAGIRVNYSSEECFAPTILLRYKVGKDEVLNPRDPWNKYGTQLELFRENGNVIRSATERLQQGTHLRRQLPFVATKSLPSGDTSSSQALYTLGGWIRRCLDHHHACPKLQPHHLPKRILQIGKHTVHLRETLTERANYACLSHCWGSKGPSLRLDKTTQSRLLDGVSINELPKTFKDTVTLCSRLGIKFVWIDALCIVQDDNDDWKEAAATMADIYENAYLTIAATWARNSDCGLFYPDPDRYKSRKLSSHDLSIRVVPPVFPIESSYTDDKLVEDFPLLYRAWCYQEQVLSPRMVHFARDQMYWQCRDLFQSESGLTTKRMSINYSRNQPRTDNPTIIENPVERWRRTVSTYSKLNLTYESDRLSAIAAIVEREMRVRKDDIYVVGMWKTDFLEYLHWKPSRGSTWRSSKTQIRHPSDSIPTWAWPSSSRSIEWLGLSTLSSVKLIDLSFTRTSPAHVGDVKDASIILQGPTCTAILKDKMTNEHDLDSSGVEILSPSSTDIQSEHSHSCSDFDWAAGNRPVRAGDDLLVMLIGMDRSALKGRSTYTGLVLREVASGVFERIGWTGITCSWQALLRFKVSSWEEYHATYERIVREYVEVLPLRQVKII